MWKKFSLIQETWKNTLLVVRKITIVASVTNCFFMPGDVKKHLQNVHEDNRNYKCYICVKNHLKQEPIPRCT